MNDDDAELGGIDPDTITSTYTFDWTEGSDEVLADLGTTGAIVSENYADDHGMEIGTRLRLISIDNRSADARVVGIYEPHPFYPLLESVTVSTELFDQLYDRPQNRWTWANVAGEPSDAGKAQLEEAVAGFPDAQVETREEWIEREDERHQRVPHVPLRAARARRAHQHLRDDQHARPLGLRADA